MQFTPRVIACSLEYNALSVEEQTDVAGFSLLFSLKVFSPEIMQILLEID